MESSRDLVDHPPLLTREDFEAEEVRRLSPLATLAKDSAGRRHPESEDPVRTAFQRDRDRVVHSTAFRRLIGKTQVFVSDTGDHYRVRLTHSLEVAQIARAIARCLRLNEDLTEALALAHDLGHAPFGHVGGDVLDELMKEWGGFEHNLQGLRILERIEVKYPNFDGLNPSFEVREAIVKHKRPLIGPHASDYRPADGPCLEAQVVDHADGIAYNSHDLDDGLRSGILVAAEVERLEIWRLAEEHTRRRYPELEAGQLRSRVVSALIDLQVKDLVSSTAARLSQHGIRSRADVLGFPSDLVGFGPALAGPERELRKFLFQRFYTHYKVHRMRNRAREILVRLFWAFVREPALLPPRFRRLAEEDGKERAVADYIAGMTDRYAQKEYGLLFLPSAGSLDP